MPKLSCWKHTDDALNHPGERKWREWTISRNQLPCSSFLLLIYSHSVIQSGWNWECKHVFFAPGSPWTSFAQQSITQCQRFMICSEPKQGWIWTATYPLVSSWEMCPCSQTVHSRFADPYCSCACGAAAQSAPKRQRPSKCEFNFKPKKSSWMDITFCQQNSGPRDF